MKTRLLLSALALSSVALTGIALADDSVPVLPSCARLYGADKATCEWQNRNTIMQFNATHSVPANPSSTAQQINLPSCSRFQGQDRATCEWKNHQTMQALLHGSSSSASSVSSSSKSSVSSAVSCNMLRGTQAVQCRRKMRMTKHA